MTDISNLDSTTVEEAGNLVLETRAVAGGTLNIAMVRGGANQGFTGVAMDFVPTAAGGATRYLALTSAKSDLGVPMTATAGTPSGTVGVSRTAGTSLALLGEATSSNAKTNKAIWEFDLPDSYIAGADIVFTVNASITGSGTLTGASCTITPALYLEADGTETAQTISAAQQMVAAGSDLAFTVTGTDLVPGSHVVFEVVMLVTTASGANTGHINAVSFVA